MESINQPVAKPPSQPLPPNRNRNLLKWVLIIIAVALLSSGVMYIIAKSTAKQQPEQVGCTQEAKLCPDGSSVGRTGPNCEFAPCPTTKESTTSAEEQIKINSSGLRPKFPVPSSSKNEIAGPITYQGRFIDATINIPSGWIVSEQDGGVHQGRKINTSMSISNRSKVIDIGITENFFGGIAGVVNKEEKSYQFAGIQVKKSLYTDDLIPPQRIIMFIWLEGNNTYLISAGWDINDTGAEGEVDQILSTFTFD